MERLLRLLSSELDKPETAEFQSAWTELEVLLTRHLDAEEHYLLPLIEAAHRENANMIRDDHEKIRALLGALGADLSDPGRRRSGAGALHGLLRDHARREESSLYTWVDYGASAAVRRRVLSALRMVGMAAARVRRRLESVRPPRNSEPPPRP